MSSNNIIVKNTLFLYFRMFFNMVISLYTSRVVLQVLGVEDFGIYSLVAGVVVLFSFLNNSMGAATQRFLNYEKASHINKKINKVFNISLKNHFVICIFVLILAETIGLYILNNNLNIPPDRIRASNIVYQMTVITSLVSIMRTPYNAIILAYEKMSYYAYVGIFETLAKLIIVYLLIVFPSFDHLIFYAVLFMLVNLITNGVLYFYCKINFSKETGFKVYRDLAKTKELLFFSGWSLLGQASVVSSTQGVNMILNIFIGVTVNAALGIANQINSAVYSFVSNVQIAFNPQIVQSYAEGKHNNHIKLVIKASRYSFFLLAIICTPILLCTEYILHLWLGNSVPEYSIFFTKVIVISSLVTSLAGPFWMSAYAVGDIRNYQIILCLLNCLILPVAYLLLKAGYSPNSVLISKLSLDFLILFFRILYFKRTLDLSNKIIVVYLINILPIFFTLVSLLYFSKKLHIYTPLTLAIYSIIGVLIVFILVVFQGLKKEELGQIVSLITRKLFKGK